MAKLNDVLDELGSPNSELVNASLEWVRERGDRPWKARCNIGEAVTALRNDPDVLRVWTM